MVTSTEAGGAVCFAPIIFRIKVMGNGSHSHCSPARVPLFRCSSVRPTSYFAPLPPPLPPPLPSTDMAPEVFLANADVKVTDRADGACTIVQYTLPVVKRGQDYALKF